MARGKAGTIFVVASMLALAACGAGASEADRTEAPAGDSKAAPRTEEPASAPSERRVDPRAGGLEIALGEWAVTPEAKTVRPGPVTLVVSNRGTVDHGFEIEADGDHSGPGGGEGFKMETRLLAPGDTVRVRVDLTPGSYEIECFVEGHDDMGMENVLRVAAGAPLEKREAASDPASVSIEDFAFAPRTLEVEAGTKVTWTNDDPTDHTVTADGFDSDPLGPGDEFAVRLEEPGVYAYRCAIHPDMEARISVVEKISSRDA